MNDIIFEQDEELQRPYTVKDLLSRARDPLLCVPKQKVNPGNWLCNLLRTQRMSREQIIEKVAKDLWLTLEKRDGVFVFRFPDVWKPKDTQEMQRTILEGIAMLEAQRSLIAWLKDLFDNFSAGMARLWEMPGVALIAVTIFGVAILLGAIYAFSEGVMRAMTILFIIPFIALVLCCSVKISISSTKDREKDLVPPCGLGGYIADAPQYVSSPPQGGDATIPVGKLKEPAMSYIAQETRKTLALIKELEAELEERSDPTRKTIPWGDPSRKAITNPDKTERSDDCYEEPQATYPTEMEP